MDIANIFFGGGEKFSTWISVVWILRQKDGEASQCHNPMKTWEKRDLSRVWSHILQEPHHDHDWTNKNNNVKNPSLSAAFQFWPPWVSEVLESVPPAPPVPWQFAHVHATFGCAGWGALVFSVGGSWYWIDTYKLSYPLKKGCYPFAVLVWTVKIRCFGATKKEWKTCFSPNTRPFAIRSFKNTGTDLYYVQTHLRFWQQLKIIKFKGHWNHHITNLTSAQRGIDCLTFHDLPCFFCNHFAWDVVSDLFFIGDWGLLAKLCFLVSWLLVINESNYTCQTFADTEEVYDNRYTCVKITSELIRMTIFMSLLSKRV